VETGGRVQQHAKVVVAYPNGRRLKGYVYDFSPTRDFFFLFPRDHDATTPDSSAQRVAIRLHELKAVFFVKDFDGDRRRYDDETLAADTYRMAASSRLRSPMARRSSVSRRPIIPPSRGSFSFQPTRTLTMTTCGWSAREPRCGPYPLALRL
jgi:hypothetical protein